MVVDVLDDGMTSSLAEEAGMLQVNAAAGVDDGLQQ